MFRFVLGDAGRAQGEYGALWRFVNDGLIVKAIIVDFHKPNW